MKSRLRCRVHAFDVLGRLDTETDPLGLFDYSYAGNTGRVIGIAYPNGQSVVYGYYGNVSAPGTGNGDKRLSSITHVMPGVSGTLSKFEYQYAAAGDITGWTQTQGGPARYYDFRYDMASQLKGADVSVGGTKVDQYAYRYDRAGNCRCQRPATRPPARWRECAFAQRRCASEQIGTTITSATHNSLNQIVAMSGSGKLVVAGVTNEVATVVVAGGTAKRTGSLSFEAAVPAVPGPTSIPVTATDPSGNITSGSLQLNVAAGTAPRSFTYDDNGNMLNDGAGRTYTWDAANRLVSITQSGTTYAWTYDGKGARVEEKVNGTTARRWVWCGMTLRAELDAAGTVTKRYGNHGAQTIASGTVNRYYSRDHLGSVREVSDAAGAVLARYQYDPWGRRTRTAGTFEADHGYTGHYTHAATRLVVAFYRQYDPVLGRWLSRDPLPDVEVLLGANSYIYVHGNPVNAYDPFGLFPWPGFGFQCSAPCGTLKRLHSELCDARTAISRAYKKIENRWAEIEKLLADGKIDRATARRHLDKLAQLDRQLYSRIEDLEGDLAVLEERMRQQGCSFVACDPWSAYDK